MLGQSQMEVGPGVEEGVVEEDEAELRKALAMSRQDMEVEDEEADLRRAIQLSMQGKTNTGNVSSMWTDRL